jgi:hypothetical protein
MILGGQLVFWLIRTRAMTLDSQSLRAQSSGEYYPKGKITIHDPPFVPPAPLVRSGGRPLKNYREGDSSFGYSLGVFPAHNREPLLGGAERGPGRVHTRRRVGVLALQADRQQTQDRCWWLRPPGSPPEDLQGAGPTGQLHSQPHLTSCKGRVCQDAKTKALLSC